MTRGFAAAAVNSFLDTTYGTTYIKLHVGDPGAAGANNAAAGDTTRKAATMASATGGSKSMTGTAGPWTNASTTETISDLSLWTAITAGTFNGSVALTANQAWVNTNTLTVTSLVLSISPLAA